MLAGVDAPMKEAVDFCKSPVVAKGIANGALIYLLLSTPRWNLNAVSASCSVDGEVEDAFKANDAVDKK